MEEVDSIKGAALALKIEPLEIRDDNTTTKKSLANEAVGLLVKLHREGFLKKSSNLGFWLNLRWVGVDRAPRCPKPLNRF